MDSAAPAPGPSFSLLETMRLEHGQVQRLERHLVRMASAARYFAYHMERIRRPRRARGRGSRASARAAGVFACSCPPTAERRSNAPLTQTRTRSLARGLRTRADRRTRSVHPPQDDTPPGLRRRQTVESRSVDDVLLWNDRGEVTESTIGNVVAEIDGIRYTPPIASGLLGGTFRAEQLEAGTIQERVLMKADIASASRLWLINSVRGWVDAMLVVGSKR